MPDSLTSLFSQAALRSNVLDRLLHSFSDLSRPDRTYGEILDIANQAVPCEASSLLLVTREDGEMTFVAASGPVADKVRGKKLAPGLGIAGACAADRRTIAVSDVSRDTRFAREISEAFGFPTRSLLAAPLLHKGELAGVLEMVNRSGGDDWTRHEIELIERVARTAGTLIHLMGGGR